MAPGEQWLFYHGTSMAGTFRRGDSLRVAPVRLAELSPGDVVVFNRIPVNAGDSSLVVHRVMKVVPGGIIARGDFNPTTTLDVVLEQDLVGRVTHRQHGSQVYRVRGGRWGWWRGQVLAHSHLVQIELVAFIRRRVFPLGRRPYQWLRQSGLVARVWHPTVLKVTFETEQGPIVRYFVGERAVAWWLPQQNAFKCRKPYDLVIPRPVPTPPLPGSDFPA